MSRSSQKLEEFVERNVDEAGRINSLAQTLLKSTAPGVPDLYQGGELWDLSLVDPDNRRPVDYDAAPPGFSTNWSNSPATTSLRRSCSRSDEGLPKLWTIHQALRAAP